MPLRRSSPPVDAHTRSTTARAAAVAERARIVGSLPEPLREIEPEARVATAHEHDVLISRAQHDAEALTRLAAESPRVTRQVAQQTELLESARDAVLSAGEQAKHAAVQQVAIDRARARLDELNPQLRTLTRVIDSRARLRQAAAEVREATDAAQSLREHVRDLRAAVQDLVTARLDNMAGELAAQLHDGDACSVCGSTTHPVPAQTARVVTPEEIATAEQSVATVARDHERAAQVRAAATSRLDVLRAEIAQLLDEGTGDNLRGLAANGSASVTDDETVSADDETVSADESARHAALTQQHDDLSRVTARADEVARLVITRTAAVEQAEQAVPLHRGGSHRPERPSRADRRAPGQHAAATVRAAGRAHGHLSLQRCRRVRPSDAPGSAQRPRRWRERRPSP
uniref:Uncharacterized protein n=1 Tax=Janibacter limosus TaxID=53458 RepID=A0AC61U8M5_9MICO|nr:hypothetical protein [Janibacter limosus]